MRLHVCKGLNTVTEAWSIKRGEQIWGVNDTRSGANLFHFLFQGLDQQLYRQRLGPVTDGSLANAAYLITVMNFLITSTPSEKNGGH